MTTDQMIKSQDFEAAQFYAILMQEHYLSQNWELALSAWQVVLQLGLDGEVLALLQGKET